MRILNKLGQAEDFTRHENEIAGVFGGLHESQVA
jgi:hypothetical protein